MVVLSLHTNRKPQPCLTRPCSQLVLALALVQLEFLSDTGRTDDASKLAGGTADSLETSADLLGLSIEELTGALLTRPLQVAREKFVKPNKVGEAQSARDALAKDVYLGIFNYLLKKINEATRYSTVLYRDAERKSQYSSSPETRLHHPAFISEALIYR